MKIELPPPIDYQLADLESIAQHIGAHLKAHRRSRKLSREVLATRAGISRRTLYQFEQTGRAEFETVLRVLRALRLIDRLGALEYRIEQSPMTRLKNSAPGSTGRTKSP